MWYHADQAKNSLDSLSKGYDIEDNKLTSSELRGKYKGDVLDQKGNAFCNLKLSDQKDMLFTAITGKSTDISKAMKDSSRHLMAEQRVIFFLNVLESVDKKEEWIKSASNFDFKKFRKLPILEKEKYHNALSNFVDKEMEKQKQPSQKKDRVSASSPYPDSGGCPDFNNPGKWKKL